MHPACIENPRETSAPRASVDLDRQRRDRQLGTDTSISAEFSTAYQLAQEFSRHICLPTISFFLSFPSLLWGTRGNIRRLFPASLYFLTLDHFSPSFVPASARNSSGCLNNGANIIPPITRRLFRLENLLCDFRHADGSSPIGGISFEDIDIYVYNDERRFQTFQGEMLSTFPFDSALQLFPTNYMMKIFLYRNGKEDLASEKSRFTEMHKMQINSDLRECSSLNNRQSASLLLEL